MPILVYKYGLLSPHDGADTWERETRASRAYRNDLIRVERERIEACRALVSAAGAAEAEAEVERLRASLAAAIAARNAARSAARSKVDPPEAKAAIAGIKAELASARAAAKEARARVRAEVAPALKTIDARAREMVAGARRLSDAGWLAKDFADAAIKASLAKLRTTGEAPRFVRWTGEDALHVRTSSPGGVSSGMYQITDLGLPPGANPQSKRSAKRRHVELSLRFSGSWVRWRMVMHRPLPPDATVLRIQVNRRKRGPRVEWTVDFVVRTAGHERRGVGIVGADVGWRLEADGSRRVLTWDGGGASGCVSMPGEVASGLAKATSLRAIRDRAWDGLAPAVAAWIKADGVPTWAARDVAHMHAWRSPDRMHRFARRWIRECPESMGARMLEAWRYHDDHLWRWEADQRRKSVLRRREAYRVEAARLAASFEFLALEGTADGAPLDLSRMARARVAGGGRVEAAPAEARAALVHAFGGLAGGRVIVVPAAGTSSTCHACGGAVAMEPGRVAYDCPTCGVELDRDANAARNIRERGIARVAAMAAERMVAREEQPMAAE